MHPLLRKHVVKKGEGMIGILKRYGLDPKDWQTVYGMGYNHVSLAGYKKLGHIEPGDEIFLPIMNRQMFITFEKALHWVNTRLIELNDTYKTLSAEYSRLTKEKSATAAYERVKGKLEALEKKLGAAQTECLKASQKTGREAHFSDLSKCLVDAAPDAGMLSELKFFRKYYKETLEDKKKADKAFKKLNDILVTKMRLIKAAQKVQDTAVKKVLEFEWNMYGTRTIKPI